VPNGELRTAANAPFRPAIQSTDQADDLDRILAYLGRSPEWTPPRGLTAAADGHEQRENAKSSAAPKGGNPRCLH
jgi:hypothetical protein